MSDCEERSFFTELWSYISFLRRTSAVYSMQVIYNFCFWGLGL